MRAGVAYARIKNKHRKSANLGFHIETEHEKHNIIILIMTTTVILTSCRIQLLFYAVFINVFLVVVQFVLGRFIRLDYLFPLSL